MSEQVIMPKEDWQGIIDAVRYGTEESALLRSGEVAPEIDSLLSTIDGIMNGSIEFFKNSRLTSLMQYAFMQHTNIKSDEIMQYVMLYKLYRRVNIFYPSVKNCKN